MEGERLGGSEGRVVRVGRVARVVKGEGGW